MPRRPVKFHANAGRNPDVSSWERFAREEGREEGEQRGEAKALLRLLQVKFGPMPPDIESRVQTAEPAQLDDWLMRILTAATPEDLFR